MKRAAARCLLLMALAAGGARAQIALSAEANRLAPTLERLFGQREGQLFQRPGPRLLHAQLREVLLQQAGEPVLLEGGYRLLHGSETGNASNIALLVTAGGNGELVVAGALRRGCWRELEPPRQPCPLLGTLSLFMAPGVGRLPGLEISLRAWAEARMHALEPPPPPRRSQRRRVLMVQIPTLG